ncbi:MAG: hypothetical protein Q4A34_02105 [Candidatus Saccharibacteria bacterium]|nr:hypothetical protein [Candidatus Saccharibacteria bacterium]
MICINCFHDKTRITNSRGQQKKAVTWRRHCCQWCGTVFTTYERPSLEDQPVIHPGGTTTPFSIGKLTISIARAFHHNKQAADFDSFHIAQTVQDILAVNHPTPSADDIAAITHTTLNRYDQLAAIQYAAQHGLMTTTRRPGRPSTAFVQPSPSPDRSSQPSSSQ